MTPQAAADRLGISRQAVMKHIASGALSHSHSPDSMPAYDISEDALDQFQRRTAAPSPGVLSVREAAEKLDAPARTVRSWIDQGHLPATMHERQWWVDEEDLEQFTPPTRGRPVGS